MRAATTAATSRLAHDGAGDAGLGAEALQPGAQRLDARLQLARVLVGLGLDGGVLLGREVLELGAHASRLVGGRRGGQAHLGGGLVDEVDRLVGQPRP